MGYPALLGIFIVSSVSMSLCFYVYLFLYLYVSLFLCLSISLYLCLSPLSLSTSLYLCLFPLSLPNLTLLLICLPICQPTPLSLSPPPSHFPDKKFPVEAHFWLDKLFYYIEDFRSEFLSKVVYIQLMFCVEAKFN